MLVRQQSVELCADAFASRSSRLKSRVVQNACTVLGRLQIEFPTIPSKSAALSRRYVCKDLVGQIAEFALQ